ncbi:MAG: hypothetical protein AB7S92_17470 [Parvibaculaceae bacterium]
MLMVSIVFMDINIGENTKIARKSMRRIPKDGGSWRESWIMGDAVFGGDPGRFGGAAGDSIMGIEQNAAERVSANRGSPPPAPRWLGD